MKKQGTSGFPKRGTLSRRAKALVFLSVLAIVTPLVFVFYESSDKSQLTKDRALLLDQLGGYYPNQTLVSRTIAVLSSKGYHVDFYEGSEVTVKLLESLPWQSYKFIIFRTHSSLVKNADGPTGDLAIYTGELYSSDIYVYEQLTDQLVKATPGSLGAPDAKFYFGIASEFIKESIHGRLDGAEILLMGCDGLATGALSKAFSDKGAAVYVSWDRFVTIPQIDRGMGMLVENVAEKGAVDRNAIRNVSTTIGPDPYSSARLGCDPC